MHMRLNLLSYLFFLFQMESSTTINLYGNIYSWMIFKFFFVNGTFVKLKSHQSEL